MIDEIGNKVEVSASILSCDMSNLSLELDKVASADWVHVDVMDNHFVPNLTWGLPVAKAVAKSTRLWLDAHLMIEDPKKYAIDYVLAGSKLVTVHFEAITLNEFQELSLEVRSKNGLMGLALKPDTAVECAFDWLCFSDVFLIMTVEPGLAAQKFLHYTTEKIAQAKTYIENHKLNTRIQVDGGINAKTARLAVTAGADILVSGSYIFDSVNPREAINALRKAGEVVK